MLFTETEQELEVTQSGDYMVELQYEDGSIRSEQLSLVVSDNEVHKIFVIGDSTACEYDSNRYPRTGWAMVLGSFLSTDSFTVVNKALSGRSSKSYYTDDNGWSTVKDAMSEGDFLFIQFGHNDSKTDEERYTDPYTTFQDYLTYYIEGAREKRAIPVLLTPIHRNKWSGTRINDSHGDYPPATRALATELDVPLIDLHNKTEELFESLGQEYVNYNIFMNLDAGVYSNYTDGNEDNTHLQIYGAYKVCELVLDAIDELSTDDEINLLASSIEDAIMVKAIQDNLDKGSVSGEGVYTVGEEVILAATEKTGYIFSDWMEDEQIVSNFALYSFTAKTDRDLTANFLEGYKVTLTATPEPGRNLSGNGYYATDSTVTVIATPQTGYSFESWNLDDEILTTDSTYFFTMGSTDIELTAVFEETNSLAYLLSDNSDFHIYPNPLTADSYLSFELPEPGNVCFEINTLSGSCVKQWQLGYCEAGANELYINSGITVPGVYICELKISNKIYKQLLIIL